MFQTAQAQSGAVAGGFRRRSSRRPGPAAAVASARKPKDAWDAQNQAKMAALVAGWTGDEQELYQKLNQLRDAERAQMEKRGLVDKQDVRKRLDDAIVFTGSCMDMCPVFERVRRQYENNVASYERDGSGRIAAGLAVKAFSRPAAGQPPPLPSDVRPPGVLQATLSYLVDHILPKLPEAHTFLWDRTRSVRQDFTYQNYFGPEAVDCNERIVRVHIVTLHVLAGSDLQYSRQQELEQLNKALQTLSEVYADVRKKGGQSPNEAEFQAYRLLSHLRDADLERQIQTLPRHVFLDPQVQLALELRALAQQNNVVERGYVNTENAPNMFARFFRLVADARVPFLFAALLETHFNDIRMWALRSMSAGYHRRGKPYVAAQLYPMLGCDDEAELLELCRYWQVAVKESDGAMCVDVTSFSVQSAQAKPPVRQAFSRTLVDAKRGDVPVQDLVNGNNLAVYPQNANDFAHTMEGLFPMPKDAAAGVLVRQGCRRGRLSGQTRVWQGRAQERLAVWQAAVGVWHAGGVAVRHPVRVAVRQAAGGVAVR
ncbi:SAC3/GANP/Nin1/mts3/eIF-3 p25 family-domain-containing protein, partial [Dipodascopsis tothii]|uniref:SAC3/GANP/Nin1/mts3/eIF-3 p25 family-domain-containing protein n=1 Tax=Dipodascopsis tothii TaxID=44089 RepID=UPI0034CE1160